MVGSCTLSAECRPNSLFYLEYVYRNTPDREREREIYIYIYI